MALTDKIDQRAHIFCQTHNSRNGKGRGLFSCLNQLLSSCVSLLDCDRKVYFDLISPFYCYKRSANALDLLLDQQQGGLEKKKITRPTLIKDRKKLHASYKKYLKPCIKDNINLLIDSFVKENFTGKTLGVHVRSTDRKMDPFFGENWERFRTSDLIAEVSAIEKRYDKIFIATDYIEYRNSLVNEFGNKVCYYSSNISINETHSIHHNSAFNKEQNMIEAFVDALLLSRCNFLLRTMSNFTVFTLSANLQLPFLDLSLKYGAYNSRQEEWLSC